MSGLIVEADNPIFRGLIKLVTGSFRIEKASIDGILIIADANKAIKNHEDVIIFLCFNGPNFGCVGSVSSQNAAENDYKWAVQMIRTERNQRPATSRKEELESDEEAMNDVFRFCPRRWCWLAALSVCGAGWLLLVAAAGGCSAAAAAGWQLTGARRL